MNSANSQFIISMLIILTGFICKKINLIKESDGEGISRVIFNITLPSLVISTFSAMKIDTSLMLVPAISMVYGFMMAILAIIIFKNESRKDKGMISMLVPGFNIGLFAYPLVEAIWGQECLKYFGMFDMGNSIIVFGVCYIFASVYSTEGVG
ncbi:MAG: AEC family transporter, partial [Sporomusaceae bacterium]|nr:AEC family transporter [Sporomusaceae bacterium]